MERKSQKLSKLQTISQLVQSRYLKSHVSRSARHNKQHGLNSSMAPSTIARKKKWERRSKPDEASLKQK